MFSKMYERGFSVIPIQHRSKAPVADAIGFDEWAENGQSSELIEHFENKYSTSKGFGIAILCGPASGIACIDVDTMDSNVLASVPLTPVIRRGRPNRLGALMMRYNPEIGNKAFERVVSATEKVRVDILCYKKYIIIPPSIHELGFPYQYATEDTLENFDKCDLPLLTQTMLNQIEAAVMQGPSYHGKSLIAGGRNDKLKQIASAMAFDGKSEEQTVLEIYEYDKLHHSPRLFTDKDENFRANNEDEARKNAFKFAHNVRGTLIKKGMVSVGSKPIEISLEDEQRIVSRFQAKQYPEPTGLIKDIRDLTVEISERLMPNIALGGAVSLMSAICSNRYRFNQCWTNTYVLNLAPTGTGKSYPQKIISKILDERLETELIGFGNYQSSSAFIKNLKTKRERFDVIDEISSLFAKMKDGGGWQAEILEEACKVWSASSGKYNAAEYADKADTSSCFNPCINILGSSTVEGIKIHIDKMMVTKGLIPRFLIFKDETYGPKSADRLNNELLTKVCEQVKRILKTEKRQNTEHKDLLCGPLFDPWDLAPVERDAMEYYEEIKDDFFKRIETEKSMPMKDMLTRGKEQTMKLATIHAAGNFRVINIQDLAWAKLTFEACLHNSRDFIEETAVDTDWEKDVQALINLFKKSGFVTRALIGDRIKRLQPQRIDQLLKYLETGEKIAGSKKKTKTRETYGWVLVDNPFH